MYMDENRNLFLYWIGHEYKLIKLLRELIYLHSSHGKGYSVHLITEQNILDYVDPLPDYFYRLCPAHQADFVRVYVICKYGGIWLDSDTLVLDSLDTLFDKLESGNGFFIRENNQYLWNGIFGSKKQTPLMIEWKNRLTDLLDHKKEKINWSEIGNVMLQSMMIDNSFLYNDYEIMNGLDNMYPVNWNNCVSEYLDKPYENYKTIIRPYQPLVVLVNSVYKALESKTEDEIRNGTTPLHYFIKQSLDSRKLIDEMRLKGMNLIREKHNTFQRSFVFDSKIQKHSDTIMNKTVSNKEIFEDIYKNKIWNNQNDSIPLSGPGSSLENTKECSLFIDQFIQDHSCESFLDLGCGDLTWMSKSPFFKENRIEYTGVDVVEYLIQKHSNTFSDKTFLCEDITKYVPQKKYSIVLIRDVIFHLTNREITSIFEKIKDKFDFIILTSCKNNINHDSFNQWRFSEKNIHIEPFNRHLDYERKLEEPQFNRNLYIYRHDHFYQESSESSK
jgi:2-polyprenyl-3-methyl-5-hydroxy-6-metoxy-1,4-benzoquinol methylase